MPSLNPSRLANVASISIVGISCSCLPPLRTASLPTNGATFDCDCMPVHPRYALCVVAAGFPLCCSWLEGADCRHCTSTTTFWATILLFRSSDTSEAGRFSRQLFRPGNRTTSTVVDLPMLPLDAMSVGDISSPAPLHALHLSFPSRRKCLHTIGT